MRSGNMGKRPEARCTVRHPDRAARLAVQSPGTRYESEGSERRTVGSVSVASGSWWTATLALPTTDPGAVFLHVERHGQRADGYLGGEDAMSLALPAGEIDAVVCLIVALVKDARASGSLPGTAAVERTKQVRETGHELYQARREEFANEPGLSLG